VQVTAAIRTAMRDRVRIIFMKVYL